MITRKFVLEKFENLTRTSLQYGHKVVEIMQRFYHDEIKSDWQLQGSVFLLCLFSILMIMVTIQWRKYGVMILGVELSKDQSRDFVDHGGGTSNLETVQEFPDEDPLTFVKKKTQ